MFLKKILVGTILLCASFCCDEQTDCAAVLCAGPPVIGLEVLSDGQNIFESDIYDLQDVTLESTEASDFLVSLATYQNMDGEEVTVLVLDNAQWNSQAYDITLNFSLEATANLEIQIGSSPIGGCCGGIPTLENLLIDGNPTQRNEGTGFFTLNLN
ncbi:hypothetical protein [Flagellimonas allohymeniacidonis]|uniref:Uncharacterized protein n=1 Tax=Flagellimonas allohymeniacidonis TaxID=2517819 RepID=A0A4Q8QIT5_9FLAO|nr:hypothetical protein [Allomuricauda hymeniacidonis]TAI48106.1 hypothetical protein EW142_15785 [Allomuricauda hymeniacidonis]